MAREYLLVFAQLLLDFRLPELLSVCELFNIEISYDSVNLSASLASFASVHGIMFLMSCSSCRVPSCESLCTLKIRRASWAQGVSYYAAYTSCGHTVTISFKY